MNYLFQDWKANKKNSKGRFVLFSFRLAHIGSKNTVLFILWIPYLIVYRFFIEWILGIEIPFRLRLGQNTMLAHGQALVINKNTIIGSNCVIRHSTTIGNKINADGTLSKSPVIGNSVDIGAHVCVLGPIQIGDNIKIGAGSIVVKDIPSNCVVAGNPAEILKSI